MMQPIKKKKGAAPVLIGLGASVLAFVVMIIVLSVGAEILGELQDDQTAGTGEHNASGAGLHAINNISNNVPLLGTVIVFAVIIAVVVGAFAVALRR